jgi:CubicO group peptidase (beta-lactamase class C family)
MGMGTVGHILELATDKTFDELLREIVAEPLGLSDTAYELSLDQVARIQRAYDSAGSPCPSWFHDVLMPQGGLRSTMTDMLTFAEAHLASDGPLVDAMARTRASHFTLPASALAVPLDPPWTDHIDHGLAWRRFDGGVYHSGTTLFYQSGFAVDADSGVGLVMLSTSRDNLAYHGLLNPIFLQWFKEACA